MATLLFLYACVVMITTSYENVYVRMCSCCSSFRWKLGNVDEFPVIWMNTFVYCLGWGLINRRELGMGARQRWWILNFPPFG